MHNLILVPSLFCPANCQYCFGPDKDTASMDINTIEYALDLALRLIEERNDSSRRIRIIFHGGEPLSAGISFFKQALPQIARRFQDSIVEFSLQSNLWLLTEGMCQLFAEYGVGLGVSLDGPEEITDVQRCKGYFQKTMNAINMARRHDIPTACLATFTRYSAKHMNKVYDFFVQEGLDFNFHQAVALLNKEKEDLWSLHPEEYGELLVNLFERYIEQPPGIKIDTLDSLCQSVAAGRGCICTFSDCLGDFFAIAPDGGIYPCQRFIAQEDSISGNGFCLGNVHDCLDIFDLKSHPFWQQLKQRQDVITDDDCSNCTYLSLCRGGCVYNTLSMGNKSPKDPYCPAYKRIYGHIIDRAMSEVFSEENLSLAVKEGGGLIKKGRLLELMRQ